MNCSTTTDDTFGPRSCTDFDFTLLFEQSILQIVPCCLLLIISIPRANQLRRRSVKTSKNNDGTIKTAALAVLTVNQLALLINWSVVSTRARTKASIPASALSFATAISLVYLSHLEHVRSVRPSSIIGLYALASLILDIPQARTLWLRSTAPSLPVLFTANLVAKISVLYIENRSKRRFLLAPYRAYAPEVLGSVYDRVLLSWLNPLFLRGYRGLISFDGLFSIDEGLGSERNQDKFYRWWNKRRTSGKRPLSRTIARTVRVDLFSIAVIRFLLGALKLSQPLLTQLITTWLATEDSDSNAGRGLIGLTTILYVGMAFINVIYKRQVDRLHTKIRGILVSAIHRKALSLSVGQLGDRAALSLLTIDTNRICSSIHSLTELLAAPLEILGAVILLERQIGICSLAPVLCSLAISLSSFVSARRAVPFQKRWLTAVQERVAYTAAVLGCPKSFRMLGLTEMLSRQIQELRVHELTQSASYRRFVTLRNTLGWMPDAFVPAVTLTVFVLVKGAEEFNPSMAFTTLSLVALLSTPIHESVLAVPEALKAMASLDRIESFLLLKRGAGGISSDLPQDEEGNRMGSDDVELSVMTPVHSDDTSFARLERVTVSRDDRSRPILDDISMTIRSSTITCIVGPVGSGKSTLLRVIIDDLIITGGNRTVSAFPKDFGYCAQEPWLPNGSIRDIILSGSLLDEAWYRTILDACELTSDLRSLPSSDETIVGSKGFSLSGGQKQRISLARALYSRSKVIILDDVTSGLDAKLANKVLRNLRSSCRSHGLAIVLATHSAQLLHHADHIVALSEDGEIAEEGSLNDLKAKRGYVHALQVSQSKEDSSDDKDVQPVPAPAQPQIPRPIDDSVQTELARQTGDFSVYKYYIHSLGWKFSSLIIISAVSFSFGRKFPELWVRWWSEDSISDHAKHPLPLWSSIYFLLGLVSIISIFFHLWVFLVWTIPRSSAKLHEQLLNRVMNAPYSFFVNVDAGVTLNRFANDMALIEDSLAGGVVQTLLGVGLCIGSAALIVSGAEYAGATIPFIIGVLYILQKFYLRTSRQLRYLELEAQAPLLAYFDSTLEGVTTIRAFGWQRSRHDGCLDLLDRSQRPYYLLLCVQRWLNLVLDLITAGMATVVVALAVSIPHTASSSSVGLSLLNILSFNTQLSYLIVAWTTLETSLGAVARCKSFEETTASEHLNGEDNVPPAEWPAKGGIKISELTASYAEDVSVLRNVSLTIPAGAKVGICGRSGSGKSSFLLTLFRMLDPSSGTIEVDGLDISTLPRSTIRNRFTALPQDLLCLPGSVAINLDPSQTHTPEALTTALEKVGLLDLISSRGGISTEMSNISLSQGEMQLFAVARALLRPSKVLIVDEMTSAVDGQTEERMMDIIKKEFRESTVIAVAHRLGTIKDFDMVVVMGEGEVLEVGKPEELIRKGGLFKEMMKNGS